MNLAGDYHMGSTKKWRVDRLGRSIQGAAANRRPAGQLDGSGNLSATLAADRAIPAAVAQL